MRGYSEGWENFSEFLFSRFSVVVLDCIFIYLSIFFFFCSFFLFCFLFFRLVICCWWWVVDMSRSVWKSKFRVSMGLLVFGECSFGVGIDSCNILCWWRNSCIVCCVFEDILWVTSSVFFNSNVTKVNNTAVGSRDWPYYSILRCPLLQLCYPVW